MSKKFDLKILKSPIKEPFWKYQAFGLKKFHFFEARRLQVRCDYLDKSGNLTFPYIYEIDTEEYLKNPKSWKNLFLVPVSRLEKVKLRTGIKDTKI